MEKQSLVSIIIPTFNRAGLIGETLDSVLNQTYQNWECIVVDDGSYDDTLEVVRNYCNKDSRIKLKKRPSNKPKGANPCRNFGLEQSNGEFILFFDSDDIMLSYKLMHQVYPLLDNPNLVAHVSGIQMFDFSGIHEKFSYFISKYPLKQNLIEKNIRWGISGPLWRKTYLEKEPFKENIQAGQDYYLPIIQTLKFSDNQFSFNDEVTVQVRNDNESITRSKGTNFKIANSRLELIKELYFKYSANLTTVNLVRNQFENMLFSLITQDGGRGLKLGLDYVKIIPKKNFFAKLKMVWLLLSLKLFQRGKFLLKKGFDNAFNS